jgi:hypothetical protein
MEKQPLFNWRRIRNTQMYPMGQRQILLMLKQGINAVNVKLQKVKNFYQFV